MTANGPKDGLVFGTVEEGMSFVGYRTERRAAVTPVTERTAMLFSALIEDANPLYWAGGRFAPWALMLSFDFRVPWHPDSTVDIRPTRIFREVPLPGSYIVNVETDTEHHKRLRVGDVVWTEGVVDSVSQTKRTRLGVGNFIRSRTLYTTDDGEPLATNINVLFRYDHADDADKAGGAVTPSAGGTA